MTQYLQFPASTGSILVEVGPEEIPARDEVIKAGLRETLKPGGIAPTAAKFETALQTSLVGTASGVINAANRLSHRPAELELTFGLKATAELGNIAVAKASTEATFTVRILWRDEVTPSALTADLHHPHGETGDLASK